MRTERTLTRRSFLARSGVGAAALLGGGASTLAGMGTALAAPTGQLVQAAAAKGLIYGSSLATWQYAGSEFSQPDPEYAALHAREAAMMFTEDDLLWWRLRPSRTAALDFSYGDRIIGDAEANGQQVFAAHMVWDSGFGDGWTEDELWGLPEAEARSLLYGTIDAEAARYAGRARAWVVANEVISHNRVDENGFWEFIPWYGTIGPTYVEEAFFHARANDPNAILVINDFGFEVGSTANGRRTNILKAIDHLQSVGADVGALGVEAHLNYQGFARNFNPTAYRSFLTSVAARGLHIFVTELDVLDDGLRGDIATIDAGVADVYKRYLDVVLQEQAVKIVITFGLTDRYTWLQEDFPRRDGQPRRPLPFDASLQPKPAYNAILQAFQGAPSRTPL
jgi:endo-1,4-beta-xylanase